MSRMPMGMYMPAESALHRANAVLKLLTFIALTAAVIMTKTAAGYAVMLIILAALTALSKLPLKIALASALRLRSFFIIIFLMNALFYSSDGAFASWWIFSISLAGIIQGANVVIRVALLMVLSTVLTCTTSPIELTSAIEALLSPLRYVGIPVSQVAMILSVAIQFIPTLSEEADTIKKAQVVRGARFESRRLSEKAASVLPLVIPIFLSAFRRADELALAMEARGYRGEQRKSKKKAVISSKANVLDYAAFAASLAICAAQSII